MKKFEERNQRRQESILQNFFLCKRDILSVTICFEAWPFQSNCMIFLCYKLESLNAENKVLSDRLQVSYRFHDAGWWKLFANVIPAIFVWLQYKSLVEIYIMSDDDKRGAFLKLMQFTWKKVNNNVLLIRWVATYISANRIAIHFKTQCAVSSTSNAAAVYESMHV